MQQLQRAPDDTRVHYARHSPEQTTLSRRVQQYIATYFAWAEDDAGADLPQFVKDKLDAFLECGVRRMAQTTAYLVNHVIPHVPVRQWMLSLSIPLRLLHQGEVILPIPGTKSVGHLLDDLGAANVRLSPEVLDRLDALINQSTVSGGRYSEQANLKVDTEVFGPA